MLNSYKRILIVEDDLSLEPFWKMTVLRWDKNTHMEWAVSSEKATEMIRQAQNENRPFHLIITDLFLAGSGTGLELLKSKEVSTSGAKTVLVTLAEEDSLNDYCRSSLPHTKFIAKPLNLVKCENALNELSATNEKFEEAL